MDGGQDKIAFVYVGDVAILATRISRRIRVQKRLGLNREGNRTYSQLKARQIKLVRFSGLPSSLWAFLARMPSFGAKLLESRSFVQTSGKASNCFTVGAVATALHGEYAAFLSICPSEGVMRVDLAFNPSFFCQ